MESVN